MKNARMAELGRLRMASLSAKERERFARIGGITANEMERAHKWTKETARIAGRLGGLASVQAKRSRTHE